MPRTASTPTTSKGRGRPKTYCSTQRKRPIPSSQSPNAQPGSGPDSDSDVGAENKNENENENEMKIVSPIASFSTPSSTDSSPPPVFKSLSEVYRRFGSVVPESESETDVNSETDPVDSLHSTAKDTKNGVSVKGKAKTPDLADERLEHKVMPPTASVSTVSASDNDDEHRAKKKAKVTNKGGGEAEIKSGRSKSSRSTSGGWKEQEQRKMTEFVLASKKKEKASNAERTAKEEREGGKERMERSFAKLASSTPMEALAIGDIRSRPIADPDVTIQSEGEEELSTPPPPTTPPKVNKRGGKPAATQGIPADKMSTTQKKATKKSRAQANDQEQSTATATKVDSPPSPSALLDKALVLQIVLAKLEACKTCDWHELSMKLGKYNIAGSGVGQGGRGKKRGKGGKGKKKASKGKKGDLGDEAGEDETAGSPETGVGMSGTELYEMYHNTILPALRAGRPLWTDSDSAATNGTNAYSDLTTKLRESNASSSVIPVVKVSTVPAAGRLVGFTSDFPATPASEVLQTPSTHTLALSSPQVELGDLDVEKEVHTSSSIGSSKGSKRVAPGGIKENVRKKVKASPESDWAAPAASKPNVIETKDTSGSRRPARGAKVAANLAMKAVRPGFEALSGGEEANW